MGSTASSEVSLELVLGGIQRMLLVSCDQIEAGDSFAVPIGLFDEASCRVFDRDGAVSSAGNITG
jgi:hypothetical protein